MPKEDSYKDYILYDILGGVPGMTARSMFGGWGIYKEGVIVGIIVDGELYLKSDHVQKKRLEEEGCYPFVYVARGKQVSMAYMSVPEEVLENPDRIEERVYESYEISRNAKK